MKRWKILLFGLVGLLVYLGGWYLAITKLGTRSQVPPKKSEGSGELTTKEVDELIMEVLKSLGYTNLQATWMVAQAKHETGNYTSAIFKENNNLFGMKLAKVRDKTATGENRGHAVYETLEDSIEDLDLWFDYHKGLPSEIETVEQYSEWVRSKGYYEDTYDNYTKGLKSWM